jgi:ABC-type phosphate/phosphonate transport system substrate-binding protein
MSNLDFQPHWMPAGSHGQSCTNRSAGKMLFLSLAVAFSVAAGDAPNHDEAIIPFRAAFSASMFTDVNENDAKAAIRGWVQALTLQSGVPVDPQPRILSGSESIVQALRSNEVDGITLTTDEYWPLRKAIPFSELFVSVAGGQITEEYLLLVHKDSHLDNLQDLRGRNLAYYQNPRASLARVWLDVLFAKAGLNHATNCCRQILPVPKLARLVLPVFFHQSDACVVTRRGFETMCELNPQLGHQLKVLATSPELVPSALFISSSYSAPFKEKLFSTLVTLHSVPAGHQVLTLFQSDRLEQRSLSCLASACDLLAAHQRLFDDSGPALAHQPEPAPAAKEPDTR